MIFFSDSYENLFSVVLVLPASRKTPLDLVLMQTNALIQHSITVPVQTETNVLTATEASTAPAYLDTQSKYLLDFIFTSMKFNHQVLDKEIT